jgi:hypothetical protein
MDHIEYYNTLSEKDKKRKLECAWDSGSDEKDFNRLFGVDGVNFHSKTLAEKGDNYRFIDAEWAEYNKRRPPQPPTDPEYRRWLGLDGAGLQLRTIIKQVNQNR